MRLTDVILYESTNMQQKTDGHVSYGCASVGNDTRVSNVVPTLGWLYSSSDMSLICSAYQLYWY